MHEISRRAIAATVVACAFLARAGSASGRTVEPHAGDRIATVQGPAPDDRTVVEKGVRIEFAVEPVREHAADPPPPLMEGELAELRLSVTDAETGAPVSPLKPAVWLSRQDASDSLPCRDRVGRYLQGLLSFQADVDLNKYFILILNDDQTISVVDPLLGVSGITQLYAMIVLKASGEDWVRSADGRQLFVTMPRAGELAVVDLDGFKVVANVKAGPRPMRVAAQPDGRYLWVANDGADATDSGVSVIDAHSLERVGFVATGAGSHEIAFSADSLRAFVLNREARTLSVIDTERLEKLADVPTAARPVTVQFSSLGNAAYVADASGQISVHDPVTGAVARRLSTSAGLVAFRLDPSGRWGFAASAELGRVDVVDLSRAALAHHLEVSAQPYQLAFTNNYAYVRHRDAAEVTLVPLAQLGTAAAPGLQRVPMGSKAPGEYPYPATADAIAPTGEWTAVVAANPADRMVYYYMEGMIAPMGSYQAYGRTPRAVGVVDRSMRETARGVYTGRFRVPRSGAYTAAVLIDAPVVSHCFAFDAAGNPSLAAASEAQPLQLRFLTTGREAGVGEPFPVVFSLTQAPQGTPLADAHVIVQATRPPGVRQERISAEALGDGRYQARIVASEPGVYYVSVAVPERGIGFAELPFFTFRARVPANAGGR